MHAIQIDQQRQLLLASRNQLEQRLESHRSAADEDAGELSNFDNHPGDLATEVYERSMDAVFHVKTVNQLHAVNAALQAIASGTYGLCATCGKPIDPERLRAIPEALHCVEHADLPVASLSNRYDALASPIDGDGDQGSENSWQMVSSWGNSDSPAFAEDPDKFDYNDVDNGFERDDDYVEPLESFLATDITGKHVSVIHNAQYKEYVAHDEGDRHLMIEDDDDEQL